MLRLVTFLLTSGCVTFCSQIREYYLINENLKWQEAQTHCRTYYTDLVTIRSQDEEMRLETVTASVDHDFFIWIGLTRNKVASWKWSVGETDSAEYTNWGHSPDSNHSCGSMRSDGRWYGALCERNYSFVCQGGEVSGQMHTINDKKSWKEAQDYCRLHYTDLISVRSDTETQAILTALRKTGPAKPSVVWIGLFRDDWTWSDQSKSSLRSWGKSLPDGSGSCCGYDPNSKEWFDMDCQYEWPFVCYRDTQNTKRHIVTVEIKKNSAFEFNEATMSDAILAQIQKRYVGAKVSWRVQPDGKIFHKKQRKKIEGAC